MGDYMHFSFRLNRNTPKHRKIIQFLDEMDVKKYKSKTNFLADAVLFYIDCIEDGTLDKVKDKNFRQFSKDYVTRDEFNERLKAVSDTIEKKIYKELLFGYVGASEKEFSVSGKAVSAEFEEKDDNDEENTLAEDLSKYSGIMDSVIGWSED